MPTRPYDLIIRNAVIIDGTRAPRFVGEIGVRVTSLDTRLMGPLLRNMVEPPGFHRVSSNPDLMYELNPGSKSETGGG